MSQAKRALRLRAEVPAEVPTTAMIMAAGLGKRMRPLTATRPKPLIEVRGKALLDHVLEKLRAAGVKKVVVNVHYLAGALEALPDWPRELAVTLRERRDLLCEGLTALGLPTTVPQGTYFATSDISSLGWADGVAFCRALPERAGVVAIPTKGFYDPDHAEADHPGRHLVRWAFCKRPEVLEEALERLAGADLSAAAE